LITLLSSIKLKKAPDNLIYNLLRNNSWGAISHSFHKTLHQEFKAVEEQKLDTQCRIREHMDFYNEQSPSTLNSPVYWCGMIARNHRYKSVNNASSHWWNHVLRFSRRDQLSFPYIKERYIENIRVLELDNSSSDWHSWPHYNGRSRYTYEGKNC
jgi:hypothetical protein